MKLKPSSLQPGKDGKPFDPQRWVEWAARTNIRSNIIFNPAMLDGRTGGSNSKNSRRGVKCMCKVCFEMFDGGKQRNKHMREEHKK